MEQIIVSSYLADKLEELSTILYHKNYFGSLESSNEYVSKIKDFILNIPSQLKRKTKKPRHGMYYARFDVKNKRTS